MIHFGQNMRRILLVGGDLAVFELALLVTLFIRYGTVTLNNWLIHLAPFTLLAFLWVAGLFIAGVYDLLLLREPLKLFRAYLEGMIANLLLALAFFYIIPIFGIAPRASLFLYFAIALLLAYLWRLIFSRFISDRFAHGRVLFVGPTQEVEQVRGLLQKSSLGHELVAAIVTDGPPRSMPDVRMETSLNAFETLLKEERITAVVLGVRPDSHPALLRALYQTLFTPINLLDRAEIEEVTTGRIPLSSVSETWFLHHLNEQDKAWYDALKRWADIALTVPFAIGAILLYPFAALAIKLSSSGPVLYSQTRVGRHGKLFRIWKFRTMHTDAEKEGPQFTADAKTDPRLFAVGRIMRILRIDELPQIWNVLRGDLSFIGPRPERPEFVDPLLERMPHYALRHLARPGLTGWAQVMFLTPNASLEDNLKKLQYDLFYIKNRSPLIDLAILLKTIGIVLRRQGT